jgi:hypothetical protein
MFELRRDIERMGWKGRGGEVRTYSFLMLLCLWFSG